MPPETLAEIIAGENQRAVQAALDASDSLALAMQWVAETYLVGGRTVYVGAGTSGRVAAADAAEMPPTFGVEPHQFMALVAGGATSRAKEGAEDDRASAVADVTALGLSSEDVIIGISASGRTPYVLSALEAAGTRTIGIANNPESELLRLADLPVLLDTGPEVLAGSTRLKAGTAQKIALNTISTGAMVLAGRVSGNMMSHMTPKNDKLKKRAIQIVVEARGVDSSAARALLEAANWNLPGALGN